MRTLNQCASFLSERLHLEGPYRWEAGFEGISGRMFTTRERYARGAGTAIDDFVEDSGIYSPGDNPAKALKPFFEKVFDCFGLQR